MFNLFKKKLPKSLPPSLEGVDLHIEEIPGALEIVEDFPRVHWDKVRESVTRYSAHPALDQIWTELAAQWFGLVRRHLGDAYKLFESDHLLLLSAISPTQSRDLLQLGDAAYNRLERVLQRTTEERGFGKHAVLILQNQNHYYEYLSYFHPNGSRTRAMSAGVYLSQGYRHTAINGKSDCHRTLVHELAHEMVSHRPLPRWLNEGLAQSVEDMVPGYRAPLIDSRQVRLHRRYWSWFGMNHFWDGTSFSGVGSQRVSYQLADILFRNLATNRTRRSHLPKFLATAKREDAGLSACKTCFDCTLTQLVEEFLGPGHWQPVTALPTLPPTPSTDKPDYHIT